MSIKEEAVQILVDAAAARFHRDAASLSADTRFVEDLHCKSVDLVALSSALEDEFEIEVPYMALKRSATFAEAGDFVANELGE